MIDLPPLPKLWTPPKPAIIRAASLDDAKLAMPLTTTFAAGSARGLRSAGNAASVAMTDSSVDPADSDLYTFSSQAFGDGGAFVVAGIVAGGVSAPTISSVTIGGVSASLIGSASTSTNLCVAFYGATPPATTGDVEVDLAASGLACGIGLFAIYDLQSTTAHDTEVSTADPGSVSIDVPAEGVCIAYTTNAVVASRYTWSGLTEDFDEDVENAIGVGHSGASLEFAAAQTGLSVTATRGTGGSGQHHLIAASFR